jgi:NAD(P)-dependent dehydrogenase (short-subunit alcohol dehydrogenase family)
MVPAAGTLTTVSRSTAPRLDTVAAIITGAASGIGRATAEAFHRAGARTLLVDIDGERLRDLITLLGDRASAYVADLGTPERGADVIAHAERTLGRVDVLVNDAGVSSKTPFLEVDATEWDRVFGVNVDAAVDLAFRVGTVMAERGRGCILNVSSISGRGGGPPQSVYGITKGALLGLTREMATALAPSVRVNAVLPGVIDTPMVRRDLAEGEDGAEAELTGWIRGAVPSGRIGRPDEVANVLRYLASDEASAISGALVPVDGGYLAA